MGGKVTFTLGIIGNTMVRAANEAHMWIAVNSLQCLASDKSKISICDEDSGPVAVSDRLSAGCTDGFIELNHATQYDGVAGKTPKGEFNFSRQSCNRKFTSMILRMCQGESIVITIP